MDITEQNILTYQIRKPPVEDGDVFAFGYPMNVHINGVRVQGVQRIETTHEGDEFSQVIIHLKGTRVQVTEVDTNPSQ